MVRSAPRLDERPAHRWPKLWLWVAAAVVLFATIAVATEVSRRSPHTSNDRNSSSPPRYLRPGESDPNRGLATRRVQSLFDAIPDLPGSARRTSAPVAALRSPGSDSGGDLKREIRSTRWAVAPGSVKKARRFYTQHPPAGLSADGEGSKGVFFRGTSDDVTLRPYAEIDLVPSGDGVAVRIDVFALWLPARTTDSVIGQPRSASTTVTVISNGHSDYKSQRISKTLDAGKARRLAREIDTLPGGVSRSQGCPATDVYSIATLTFDTAQGQFMVTPTYSACGDVTMLRTPAGRMYALGLGTVYSDLMSAVGLPTDFGQH